MKASPPTASGRSPPAGPAPPAALPEPEPKKPEPGAPAAPPRASPGGEGRASGRQVTAGAKDGRRREREREGAAGGPPRASPYLGEDCRLPPPRIKLYSPLSRQSGGR